MQPAVRKLESEYSDRISFERYDIDLSEDAKMVKRFRVVAVPTFVTLDGNGDQLFKHVGGLDYNELKKDIEYALKQ
jgi:thiol-disulfide isomerase/thioredoxin